MTDTTDIKALRERMMQQREAALTGNTPSFEDCELLVCDLLRALTLSNKQLEAERQRDAGSEEELHKALHRDKAAERKLLAAQAEVASLKGEQVPVAYLYMGDEMECKHVELAEDTDEGQAKNCLPLFTAPQKPIVLPQAHKVRAGVTLTGDERIVMIPCNNGNWLSRFDVDHAIKMAGGIVKDGE